MSRIRLTSLLSLGLLCACTAKEFDPDNPKKSYVIAKEPYDDENYEIAMNKLGEFKSRFPYSQYATEAEWKEKEARLGAASGAPAKI